MNLKALAVAEGEARSLGCEVERLSAGPDVFSLYNADLHAEGVPPAVAAAREKVRAADLILIASPEYNYSVTGVLKNAIDWCSVNSLGNVLDGKVAALLGVSNGPMKTVRGQFHLRQILTAVNVLVIPQPQVLMTKTDFGEDGTLNPAVAGKLKTLIERTVRLAEKLK